MKWDIVWRARSVDETYLTFLEPPFQAVEGVGADSEHSYHHRHLLPPTKRARINRCSKPPAAMRAAR